jgi:hypothetical protein
MLVTCVITNRICDYHLGGKDNFAVDRETAEQVVAAWPLNRVSVTENRAWS